MNDPASEGRGVWMEPGGYYFAAAMDELGIDGSDIETVDAVGNVPAGEHIVLDSIYERAWELRDADEAD